MTNFPAAHVLALESKPIFEQLQLEEALLRAGSHNYCLFNSNSSPAIVMGISGKKEELVEPDFHRQNPVPIIRRFSGGGCVLVGPQTLFLTFICNRADVDIGTCPKKLLHWTEEVLKPVFPHVDFRVQENDYAIGDKKFGGNAQYFTKDRWLHHASILWDYSPEEMKVLKMPPKIPEYRLNRTHDQFLCRLNSHFATKNEFFDGVLDSLGNQFALSMIKEDEVHHLLDAPHRKATVFVT